MAEITGYAVLTVEDSQAEQVNGDVVNSYLTTYQTEPDQQNRQVNVPKNVGDPVAATQAAINTEIQTLNSIYGLGTAAPAA